jgi:hypothetical protein
MRGILSPHLPHLQAYREPWVDGHSALAVIGGDQASQAIVFDPCPF